MELYFCVHLTENEHFIAADQMREKCKKLGLKVQYWRKLKDGHVPMYREVKVSGTRESLNRLKKWMREEDSFWLINHIERNPHKIKIISSDLVLSEPV